MKPVTLPGIEEYVTAHTTPDSQAMVDLARRTHEQLIDPQMMSGPVQGRFLELLVRAVRPRRILEIGTFSGYAAATMAAALGDGAAIDTCEIDPRHADLARRHIETLGFADRVTVHEGPAAATVERLAGPFDLVWLDADKQGYRDYLEAVLPKLAPNGLILADNTLWNGDVLDTDAVDADTVALQDFNDAVVEDTRLRCTLLTIRDGVTMIGHAR